MRVQPRAGRNRITGRYGAAMKVQLTAPPVDGAANLALAELLAEALGVSKHAVRLIAGAHSRDKIVEVETTDQAEMEKKLESLVEIRDERGRIKTKPE